MDTAAMNLFFINVITGNTMILEILNNTPTEDRAELCLNSIFPFLNIIISDDLIYYSNITRVTHIDIVDLSEDFLILDIECKIAVFREDEDVISKIKEFEAINGDIRKFATVFWFDKENKKPISFDGWDKDEFSEQLEEEIVWFEPDEDDSGNTFPNMF